MTQWGNQVVRYGGKVGGGGAVSQTLRYGGRRVVLKKKFSPLGLKIREVGRKFKGYPGPPPSESATVIPLEGWLEMAIGH